MTGTPRSGESELGRAIKMRRAELDMSRKELALTAGLSYPYISEIENGQKAPSYKALMNLAKALELSPSHLVQLAGRLSDESLEESVLVSPAMQPSSRPVRREPTWIAASMEPPRESLAEIVREVVRSELRDWAFSELPGIIRDELATLKDEDEPE